ncbi:MAG: hypothetical protein JWO03_267 [Bacteroidetes bacterium]|nr:hypothetical protein [Bacteroidota bacterium]
MFRHQGKSRTLKHNLQLAALLSLVAGIVNVTGYFAVHTLTTNVTGHFAFFANEVLRKEYSMALLYLVFIFAFFFGAFFSSLIVELISRRNSRYVYIAPVAIEATILIVIALLSRENIVDNANIISCSLLFAMGLQNSLVTNISNSVVRTTHLTGLFTDLGIELSQIFFYREPEQQKRLRSSIGLRLTIISFFFMGCIAGGFAYYLFGIFSLLLAAAILIAGVIYDGVKYRVTVITRKYSGH